MWTLTRATNSKVSDSVYPARRQENAANFLSSGDVSARIMVTECLPSQLPDKSCANTANRTFTFTFQCLPDFFFSRFKDADVVRPSSSKPVHKLQARSFAKLSEKKSDDPVNQLSPVCQSATMID